MKTDFPTCQALPEDGRASLQSEACTSRHRHIQESLPHFRECRHCMEHSPESIPETGVGVKISVTDLSIVRTVVDRFAGSVELIEFSREEKTAVQTRVESAVLVSASSSDLDAV